MNEHKNTDLLKNLGDFALIHQKMALNVHLNEEEVYKANNWWF